MNMKMTGNDYFFWKVVKKQLVYDKNRVTGMGKASYLHLKIKSMLQQLTEIDPGAFLNVNSYSVKILSKKSQMKPFSVFLTTMQIDEPEN